MNHFKTRASACLMTIRVKSRAAGTFFGTSPHQNFGGYINPTPIRGGRFVHPIFLTFRRPCKNDLLLKNASRFIKNLEISLKRLTFFEYLVQSLKKYPLFIKDFRTHKHEILQYAVLHTLRTYRRPNVQWVS